jgi:hypothetical protein
MGNDNAECMAGMEEILDRLELADLGPTGNQFPSDFVR